VVLNKGLNWLKQVSFLLCLRYLQHRKIVLLSIVAVALSCALLVATDSLFTGFIDAVETSVGKYMGDIILEAPPGTVITEYETLIESLESAACIQSVTSILQSEGLLLVTAGKVRPVKAWGIELPRGLNVMPLRESLLFQKNKLSEQIGFDVPGDPEAVGGIVGVGVLAQPDEKTDEYDIEALRHMLGEKMALTTGSIVQSDTQTNDASGIQISRKVMKFQLADVLMTGVYEFDEAFILLPIEKLSEILHPDKGGVANIIHIRLAPGADGEKSAAVVRGIWQNFAENRFPWYGSARIALSKEIKAPLVAEYQKQMKVLLFIFGLISMGIIILVFCIFYLIVMTRRKDIGILKSCGLSNFSAAGLFVLFGTIVGLAGSVLGIGLGYLIIRNINGIERMISLALGVNLWRASTYQFMLIPNTMNWNSVLWVTAAGVIAAAVGSLVPAIAAARVRPVETLQYE